MSERPSKRDEQSVKTNALRSSKLELPLSPIVAGLTLIGVRCPTVLDHARATVERQIATQGNKLGLVMPSVKEQRILLAGKARDVEVAKALAQAESPDGVKAITSYDEWGARATFNWTSTEGICVLESALDEVQGMAVTLAQDFGNGLTAAQVNSLSQLHAMAIEMDAYFFLFAGINESYSATMLHEFYEYIEVKECEPDPDCSLALSFNCVSLKRLHALGVGYTMCSIRFKDGKIQRRWHPFVSDALRERAMWMMRSQGASLSEIGKIFSLDKSTVKRQLDKLPQPVRQELPDDWFDRYAEALGIDLPELAKDEA